MSYINKSLDAATNKVQRDPTCHSDWAAAVDSSEILHGQFLIPLVDRALRVVRWFRGELLWDVLSCAALDIHTFPPLSECDLMFLSGVAVHDWCISSELLPFYSNPY